MRYLCILEFSLDLCDRVEKTSIQLKNKCERFLIEFCFKTLLFFLTILTAFRLQSGQLSIIKNTTYWLSNDGNQAHILRSNLKVMTQTWLQTSGLCSSALSLEIKKNHYSFILESRIVFFNFKLKCPITIFGISFD
jgi:hypothetical protein